LLRRRPRAPLLGSFQLRTSRRQRRCTSINHKITRAEDRLRTALRHPHRHTHTRTCTVNSGRVRHSCCLCTSCPFDSAQGRAACGRGKRAQRPRRLQSGPPSCGPGGRPGGSAGTSKQHRQPSPGQPQHCRPGVREGTSRWSRNGMSQDSVTLTTWLMPWCKGKPNEAAAATRSR
jgi:hypothetical protein